MEFLKLLIPFAAMMSVLLVLARLIAGKADKNRSAEESERGRIQFTPNRRSYWGVYLFIACFGFVAIASLVQGHGANGSLAVPAAALGFILLLLMAFPATIVVDEQGIEQIFWLRGRKRIAWKEVATIALNEKSGEVKITGKNGVKILHTRQLPDHARLVSELDKHRAERATATVAAPAFAVTDPAA